MLGLAFAFQVQMQLRAIWPTCKDKTWGISRKFKPSMFKQCRQRRPFNPPLPGNLAIGPILAPKGSQEKARITEKKQESLRRSRPPFFWEHSLASFPFFILALLGPSPGFCPLGRCAFLKLALTLDKMSPAF
jgi:hypothetical protein